MNSHDQSAEAVHTSESPRRRKPRPRKLSKVGQERRQDLIEATIRTIGVNGYDAVTVASICEEAGFSRGLIGHYFSGKDELLLESVRTVAYRLGSAIRESSNKAGRDPEERLHALVRASFTAPGFTSNHVAVWASLVGVARWSPQLAVVYQEIWRDYRHGVGRLFASAAKKRGVEIDTQMVALTFSQMVEGMWVGWNADPRSIPPEVAQGCCHAYIRQIVGNQSPD